MTFVMYLLDKLVNYKYFTIYIRLYTIWSHGHNRLQLFLSTEISNMGYHCSNTIVSIVYIARNLTSQHHKVGRLTKDRLKNTQ